MNPPFPPGSALIGYFRDSGGDKQNLSVIQQETNFREWCLQNGYLPGHTFTDKARPGTSTAGREAFQDMMYYLRAAHQPEAGIVIWSYNRFARDIDDAQFFRAEIRHIGYEIYSLNDDIPEGPMGRLFEALLDWKNDQFIEDLKRDVKRGLRFNIEHGAIPGTPPRGFKREPITLTPYQNGAPHIVHRWVPDPDQLPAVRRAWQMRASGHSLKEINTETNLFTSLNSYQTFFTNKLYLGDLEFGDLTIENYTDPIIDIDTWNAVQEIIQRHAGRRHIEGTDTTHPRRQHSAFLLSGLARCARCNSPLSAHTVAKKGSDYIYEAYECSRARRRRDCDLKKIPRPVLENAVLDQCRQTLATSEYLTAIQTAALKNQAEHKAQISQQRKEKRAALSSVRQRITKLTRTLEETSTPPRSILQRLHELESQEMEHLIHLSRLDQDEANQAPALDPTQIHDLAAHMQLALDPQKNEPAEIQQVLRGFIKEIMVDRHETHITGLITFYYPPAQTMSTSRSPMGAPFQRHSFTLPIAASMRPYRKKP